jgi:hypothetical protein
MNLARVRQLQRTWLAGGIGLIACGVIGMLRYSLLGTPGVGQILDLTGDILDALGVATLAIGLATATSHSFSTRFRRAPPDRPVRPNRIRTNHTFPNPERHSRSQPRHIRVLPSNEKVLIYQDAPRHRTRKPPAT